MLYSHQLTGLEWLWSLFEGHKGGGILADDMGLGKTMQCSAFLAGLMTSKLIRRAIIVAPKTLLAQWEKELSRCGMGSLLSEYFGTSQASRQAGSSQHSTAVLRRVTRSRGILLTTYGMVLHNAVALARDPAQGSTGSTAAGEPLWDPTPTNITATVCLQGHKIKNSNTQLAQRLREIPAGLRVIISGTPIQNNLMELHSLFDFVAKDLLGDVRSFKVNFERCITAGNDKHAGTREREQAASKAAALRSIITPYFLRREKKEVLQGIDRRAAVPCSMRPTSAPPVQGSRQPPAPPGMGHKNDLILWLTLHPLQQRVYEAFLTSGPVRAALNKTGSALAALTVLKKICDHPALLSEKAAHLVASAGEQQAPLASVQQQSLQHLHMMGPCLCLHGSRPVLPSSSCKTMFVIALLKELIEAGHRALIFSQSRVMLDILQAAIQDRGYTFCRIDGSIASTAERQNLVESFQTDTSIPIFLLTSQVGGLGLTLTGADRVIIIDPAWNPAVDNQSVDRAYRIGQARDVVVYRLMTCGTIEDRIYRKQVFKGGLSRSGTEAGTQFRYFSQQELRDLFSIVPEELLQSKTQQTLHAMHAPKRKASEEVKEHLQRLQHLPHFAGLSDHDLLYT
eukprot:jgi/Astpho2/6698/gw1.00101.139.1_t